AFPIVSTREVGTTYNCDDVYRATLTSSTTLQLSGCAPDSAVDWQVVEYANSSVQTGSVSLATGDLSKTSSLASSVDVTKSWLLFSYKTESGTATNIGQKRSEEHTSELQS